MVQADLKITMLSRQRTVARVNQKQYNIQCK